MNKDLITNYEKIKKLNISDLENQADLIRKYIIETVSNNGGHLSSNLGVVELTLAIHYVFNSPIDKIIFDVGHQDYAHKILTDRCNEFETLRKKDGISGFPSYSESIHDAWEGGHSSTSITSAIGMAIAKESGVDNIGEIIAIIGDGSISNGLALSGLNYLVENKKNKIILIVNDNEMSIGASIGAISKSLSEIKINDSNNNDNNLFTSLGFKYLGPIDGHDIKLLINCLKFAKDYNESIIIHVKTIKGKGYKFAEEDKVGKWHGVGPFNIETGEFKNNNNKDLISWNKIASSALNDLLNKRNDIKVICPGMLYGTGLDIVKNSFPNKVIDVGINEEMAFVMAAALAKHNIIPIVSVYSTFFQRAYDEANNEINRTNSHVVILLDHCGIVSHDGSTHQGIYDLSLLTHLNNFVISAPKNQNEFNQLLDISISHKCPFAIRYSKDPTLIDNDNKLIEFGKWIVELELRKTNIISYGNDVTLIKEELISQNTQIGLINAIFIKPIDYELLNSLKDTTLIIYEEVASVGSLSSLISEYSLKNNLNIHIIFYNIISDKINLIKEGTKEEILDQLGLNIKNIIQKY